MGQATHRLSSAAIPNRSAWSGPGPQSHQGSRQTSGSQAAWGPQLVGSPGSTATSKLQPSRQAPGTPLSQVKSESGSTVTEYATPPSTLRPWQDLGQDTSPSSSEGRLSTPKGQRLTTRFTAACEVTPAHTCTPVHKALDKGGHCSLDGATAQAVSKSVAPGRDESHVAYAAHLDLLAADHPQQVVHEKPGVAAPALADADLRLAELHAHIIAGELCWGHCLGKLHGQHHPALSLHLGWQGKATVVVVW